MKGATCTSILKLAARFRPARQELHRRMCPRGRRVRLRHEQTVADGECPIVNFERHSIQHEKPVAPNFENWLIDFVGSVAVFSDQPALARSSRPPHGFWGCPLTSPEASTGAGCRPVFLPTLLILNSAIPRGACIGPQKSSFWMGVAGIAGNPSQRPSGPARPSRRACAGRQGWRWPWHDPPPWRVAHRPCPGRTPRWELPGRIMSGAPLTRAVLLQRLEHVREVLLYPVAERDVGGVARRQRPSRGRTTPCLAGHAALVVMNTEKPCAAGTAVSLPVRHWRLQRPTWPPGQAGMMVASTCLRPSSS